MEWAVSMDAFQGWCEVADRITLFSHSRPNEVSFQDTEG
jgi:hypothetical protein